MTPPPQHTFPARGHDSPQPQILPLLSSTLNGPDTATRNDRQPHWPLPSQNPAPLAHGAAEVSPCCSSVTLSALHTTQYRGKPEAAAVAGKEWALRQELLLIHAALGLAIR